MKWKTIERIIKQNLDLLHVLAIVCIDHAVLPTHWTFADLNAIFISFFWWFQVQDASLLTTTKEIDAWETKKGNAAVYAIQGRRPHMEDRFNIVDDLEHTKSSLYGIFDGHGGDVGI